MPAVIPDYHWFEPNSIAKSTKSMLFDGNPTKKEKGRKKKLLKKIQKATIIESNTNHKGINSYKAFHDCLLMGLQVTYKSCRKVYL